MTSVRLVHHGVIQSNPQPDGAVEIYSGTALTSYLDGAEEVLLCAFRVGTEKVGADGRVVLRESRDGGRSWMPVPSPLAGALAPAGGNLQLAGPHIGSSTDGTVVLVAARMRVVTEGEPGFDAQAAGIVDAECVMLRFRDGEWSQPLVLDGRRSADEWAIPCGPPVHLGDGRWLAPAERHAKAHVPEWLRNYHAFEMLSTDDGASWSVAGPMLNDPEQAVVYYDQHVTLLDDGRLLTLAWVHDVIDDVTLTARAGWSDDEGSTWSAPRDTSLRGGPAAPANLGADRIIAAFPHRTPPAGVRVCLSNDGGATWDPESELVVWDETTRTITGRAAAAPVESDHPDPLWDTMWGWSFGLPTITALSDGTIGLAFYATETDGAPVVRFARLAVEGD